VIASHSNARAIIPTDRHLSDPMIQAIARKNGVIGVNLFDRFLIPPAEYGSRKAVLADAVRQFRYFADLLGSVKNIGLGSDMDGGFGYANLPKELRTIADLPKLADALSAGGFSDSDIRMMIGGNWLRYFGENLPG
jgi:membrane dipeptidase